MDSKLKHSIDALSNKGKDYLFLKAKERWEQKKSFQPKKLVAYVESNSNLDPEILKEYLKKQLPEYMVPSFFIKVNEFPKLPNGKVDRNALTKIAPKTISSSSNVLHQEGAVDSAVTSELIAIWEQVLNIKPVHPKDNFFELGGDSILSIQLIAEARKKDIKLTPNLLFEYQTIEELVNHLENLAPDTSSSLEQALITIWENVLGTKPIHKNDNFFELGGDSILSIQVIAKARKKGIQLNPNQLFEHQTIAQLVQSIQETGAPSETLIKEQVEKDLIAIWEEILDVRPINVQDNFFEVGGDSILSIQLIAKARQKGIQLNPNQLFEYQSIEALMPLLLNQKPKKPDYRNLSGKVGLTPIQHWFFDTHKHEPELWNQAVMLKGVMEITKEQFQENILFLVTEHDALRLSFLKENDVWSGYVLDSASLDCYSYIDLSNIEEGQIDSVINKHLDDYQNQMVLTNGGLFKGFYFKISGSQSSRVVFLAHHLVVDQTSLNIISQDFLELVDETKNQTQSAYFTKTTTIDLWNSHLRQLGETDQIAKELPYWKKQTSMPGSIPIPDNISLPLLEKDVDTIKKVLGKNDSERLLAHCNAAYSTKIEDLLITALGITVGGWSNQEYLNLGVERHGRETMGTEFDLSRTVNWFTTYFPLKLKVDFAALESNIETIRDQLNNVPNNGLGYGILKYLNKQTEVDTIPNFAPEVVFNYLGQLQRNLSNANGVQKEMLNEFKLKHDSSERFYHFEVNIAILNGFLTVNWSYGTKVFKKTVVDALVDEYLSNLKKIIQHCMDKDRGDTPTGFLDTPLDQEDLDNLLNALD